jgi:hypothetical protein
MNALIDSQALADRFNEEEAVWRHFEQNRQLRRVRGSLSPLSEETLDHLDWLEAERKCREMRCVGRLLS